MKGVVLAGGTGSRLAPLTNVTNKHLLPVGGYPMIYYPVSRLVSAGIRDILVVTGGHHREDVVRVLGSGDRWDADFTYRVQKEPGGVAQAVGLAEEYVGDERFVVILGDNIFREDLAPYLEHYRRQESGARVLLKQVENPQRFGVAELRDDTIVKIHEKPEEPPSSYCVTGLYMYDRMAFDYIDELEPSRRGELEISGVNNRYIEQDTMCYDVLDSWWIDAGTFPDYLRCHERVSELGAPVP